MRRTTKRILLALACALTALILAAAVSHAADIGPLASPPADSAPPKGAVPPPQPTNAPGNLAQAQAIVNLAWQTRSAGHNLPGGCATISGQTLCTEPVVVDGHRIPDLTILGMAFQVLTAPGTTYDATNALHAATSEAVLDRLLYEQGVKDGREATAEQASAQAQYELSFYRSALQTNPAVARMMVPPDTTAEAFFSDPITIAGYRAGLTVATEHAKLLLAAGITAGQNDHPAMVAFLQQQLSQHHITIGGAPPAFAIDQSLPGGK